MAVYYDKDADSSLILSRRVAVLGFGAQGRAHALNLHDSGVNVVVGLRDESPSREVCRDLGLETATPGDAVASADFVMMLIPDNAQPHVYRDVVEPALSAGSALGFAHGYSIHFGYIRPREDIDVLMVAPLGIGDQVRAMYEEGSGVPALLAIHQDASGLSTAIGLSYAWANGHGRVGVLDATFRDETETDLFAEQVVLCGGLTHLISDAFDTLVDAGYPATLAYFCCLHEVKLIADLVYARGIAGMRRSISGTAEFGDYTRGPRIINEQSRQAMREILDEIRDGSFAKGLAQEFANDRPVIKAGRKAAETHEIERVGARLRRMMSREDD
ncbi:MAG: ketol-acid reductoisomerase [Gammaproteobacteria bacterium]